MKLHRQKKILGAPLPSKKMQNKIEMTNRNKDPAATPSEEDRRDTPAAADPSAKPIEYGGPKGLEPTRYGDWERKGRCIDF